MLRQEAAEAVAKLKTRKYRQKVRKDKLRCSNGKQLEHERRDSEVCAVCLDEFRNNQVRVSTSLQI